MSNRIIMANGQEQICHGNEMVRTEPISRKFGLDRGTSICRYYIDKYLSGNEKFITGCVLEIGDSRYTMKYGRNVVKSDVLNAVPSDSATIVGDLTKVDCLPENYFDCIILAQTLQFIYDFKTALKNAIRALRPGGTILLTATGITQISRYDMDRWGDYWRFTNKSLQKMFAEFLPEECFEVKTYGNVATAKVYLDGLASEDIDKKLFEYDDNDYQVVLTVRATKPVIIVAEREQYMSVQKTTIFKQPVVLIYHRVAEEMLDSQYLAVSPANFREHLKELNANYRVVPLRQLLKEVQNGTTQPNTVALTFDDGYLDNLTNAMPLLEEYGTHATIFITAANVEQSKGFWGDKVEYLFLGNHRLPEVLEIRANDKDYIWPLTTAYQRLIAHDQIRALLRGKANSEIEAFVCVLLRWAGIQENLNLKPALNILQLRQLAMSQYVEIGAHTMTHTKLSMLSPAQQKIEIVESRKKLELWTSKPVTIFSYPYGSAADYTNDTKTIVRQAGFEYGIANIQASVSPDTDLFEVPRRLVRNWSGIDFAEWMKSEDKGFLEKSTLAQRADSIIRFVSAQCAADSICRT